jgi:SagB-type dehydrogenase family enzyme
LPAAKLDGRHRLAQLLEQRRSVRDYAVSPLTLAQVGQLLWAAQGITSRGGLRTAPSAGALYPLAVYVVAGRIEGVPAGVYRYDPHAHRLVLVRNGDQRHALASAAVRQTWLAGAPAIMVLAADYARTSVKYGGRAGRYVHIEAGAAAENLFLQAEDLGLGTVVVGSFDDQEIAGILQLPGNIAPLLLMPVGAPR